MLNLVGVAAETAAIIVLRDRSTPSATIGAVMACAGLGAVAGAALAPRMLKKLRTRPLCLVTAVLWTLGLGAFALAPAPQVMAPLLVAMLLLTPGLGIRLSELTVGLAPRDLLGRISTAERTINAGLASFGPVRPSVRSAAPSASRSWLEHVSLAP